jgi:hypothetical protein
MRTTNRSWGERKLYNSAATPSAAFISDTVSAATGLAFLQFGMIGKWWQELPEQLTTQRGSKCFGKPLGGNPQKRTSHMIATEVDGHNRVADVTGTIEQNGWLSTTKGPAVTSPARGDGAGAGKIPVLGARIEETRVRPRRFEVAFAWLPSLAPGDPHKASDRAPNYQIPCSIRRAVAAANDEHPQTHPLTAGAPRRG